MTRNFGILFAYIFGAILQYKTVPYVFGAVPIVYAIWFYFLPNTPQFLLQKSKLKVRHDLNLHKTLKNIKFFCEILES